MKDRDVWFTRLDGVLYAAWALPDEEPQQGAKVLSVRDTLMKIRKNGYNPVQIGIVPPDALGLE